MALKLSDLTAALASKSKLSGDLATAQQAIVTLTRERDQARQERDTERTRAEGLQQELTDGQAQIDQLTQQVNGLQQEQRDVSTEAREQLNQLGVAAADLPASQDPANGAKEMKLSEFSALPILAQNEFIRGGGKLI